jgi:hypothetical protein
MLPLISSRMSSGVFAFPSAIIPTAEQIWPGVRYPHWKASWSMNACCRAWSTSPRASPSTVVTSAPSFMTARVMQELMRVPLTRTVQAPHCPWSHPFFVPVRPRCSRRASSRVVHGSTSSTFSAPLTVRAIRSFAGGGGAPARQGHSWVPLSSGLLQVFVGHMCRRAANCAKA